MTEQSIADEIIKDHENVEFKILEKLGSGAFGQVFKAKSNANGKIHAIKIFRIKDLSQSRQKLIQQEGEILKSLNHPNIVKFEKIVSTKQFIYLVMEWVQGGTLQKIMTNRKKCRNPFNELEASLIMQKIISALVYLHDQGIIHRDIKLGYQLQNYFNYFSENVMLHEESNLSTIKLIDFGLSAIMSEETTNTFINAAGTPIYLPPECLNHRLHSKPVDIWSCGILMFLLCCKGRHPFYKKSDTLQKIKQRIQKNHIKFQPYLSFQAKDLIIKMLKTNPSERYTAIEIQQHPWITRDLNAVLPLTQEEFKLACSNQLKLFEICKAILFLNYLNINCPKHSIGNAHSFRSKMKIFIKIPQNIDKSSQQNIEQGQDISSTQQQEEINSSQQQDISPLRYYKISNNKYLKMQRSSIYSTENESPLKKDYLINIFEKYQLPKLYEMQNKPPRDPQKEYQEFIIQQKQSIDKKRNTLASPLQVSQQLQNLSPTQTLRNNNSNFNELFNENEQNDLEKKLDLYNLPNQQAWLKCNEQNKTFEKNRKISSIINSPLKRNDQKQQSMVNQQQLLILSKSEKCNFSKGNDVNNSPIMNKISGSKAQIQKKQIILNQITNNNVQVVIQNKIQARKQNIPHFQNIANIKNNNEKKTNRRELRSSSSINFYISKQQEQTQQPENELKDVHLDLQQTQKQQNSLVNKLLQTMDLENIQQAQKIPELRQLFLKLNNSQQQHQRRTQSTIQQRKLNTNQIYQIQQFKNSPIQQLQENQNIIKIQQLKSMPMNQRFSSSNSPAKKQSFNQTYFPQLQNIFKN